MADSHERLVEFVRNAPFHVKHMAPVREKTFLAKRCKTRSELHKNQVLLGKRFTCNGSCEMPTFAFAKRPSKVKSTVTIRLQRCATLWLIMEQMANTVAAMPPRR